MDDLENYREALKKEGCSTEAVDSLVAKVASSKSVQELAALLKELESEANKLSWPFDRDYAALALEHASAKSLPLVGREMLKFALDRAEWCASCATAGGEGLARSRHVRELESLLRHTPN